MTEPELPAAGRLGVSAVPESGESFAAVARIDAVRIEEITSSASPDTRRQVQDHDEWVVLLAGFAELELAGELRTLVPGDWLVIPARTPHRVVRTAAGSRWLALHGPDGLDV